MKVDSMPWIDLLPEVGDPIRRQRDALDTLARIALKLEREIVVVRSRTQAQRQALLLAVSRQWSLAEIETASRRADAARSALATEDGALPIEDGALRGAVQDLAGVATAVDAIVAFARTVAPTGFEWPEDPDEARKAIARVRDWWQVLGKPVADRLTAHGLVACKGARQ